MYCRWNWYGWLMVQPTYGRGNWAGGKINSNQPNTYRHPVVCDIEMFTITIRMIITIVMITRALPSACCVVFVSGFDLSKQSGISVLSVAPHHPSTNWFVAYGQMPTILSNGCRQCFSNVLTTCSYLSHMLLLLVILWVFYWGCNHHYALATDYAYGQENVTSLVAQRICVIKRW